MKTSSGPNGRQSFYTIDLAKKLTVSNIPEVTKAVECGLKMNHKIICFNLEKTVIIDSRGIGFLASLHKQLQKVGGKVCLVSLKPSVATMIQSCQLHKVIPIYTDTRSLWHFAAFQHSFFTSSGSIPTTFRIQFGSITLNIKYQLADFGIINSFLEEYPFRLVVSSTTRAQRSLACAR